MSEGAVHNETIRLNIETPKSAGGGLAELVRQLDLIHTRIQKVNAELNRMDLGPSAARSQAALQAEIKALQTKGVGLSAPELGKSLNLDLDRLRVFLEKRRRLLKDDYTFSSQTFSSPRAAAEHISAFERSLVGKRKLALSHLLTPTATEVHGVTASAAGVKASVEGQIPLAIPAAQVQASVIGQVTLNVPGGQVSGTAAGRDGKGRFLPTKPAEGEAGAVTGRGGGGGGGRRKKKSGPLDVPPQPGEFRRERVEDLLNDRVRETVTRADALGQTVSETWDSVEQAVIKRVKKSSTGTSPLAKLRTIRQLEEETFRAGKAGVSNKLDLANLQERQAGQLQAILTPELKAALGKSETQRLQSLLDARATTLRAEAERSRREHAEQVHRETEKKAAEEMREQGREVQFERHQGAQASKLRRKQLQLAYSDTYRTGRGPFFAEMAQVEEERAQRLETALKNNPLIQRRQRAAVESDIRNARANVALFTKQAGGVGPSVPSGEYARFLGGLKAFTPMGMLANLTKVTGWAAAVMVLYKSVELARYSFERFLDIAQQTARLEQVFKGVGGSAQELTDDILKLADANGRSTEEAMESGVEWARLGLNRAQVNEAVRVSLEAANVANMHAKETTKQLASLMHVYGMEVKDLQGVLGMLTSTSQRYNVTLEDLFTGLDRSAGVARLAGMSLGELQGILGATVGKTGQSGIIVGNTIKSILVQFSNPQMQKLLRSYGVETLTREGQQKSGSEVLRSLFVRWQSLDNRERQALTQTLAGRQQGARFVAMMDNYVQGQKLAIDSQLDLNRAQEANARIMGTLKAQLAGVRSEWDRLVVSVGKQIGPSLAEGARFTKNLLRWYNEPGPPDPKAQEFRKRYVEQSYDKQRYEDYLTSYQKTHNGQLPGFGSVVFPSLKGPAGNLGGGQRMAIWLKFKEESAFERGTEEFQNDIQKHHAAAAGYGMRARLFETLSKVLPGSKNLGEAGDSMARMAASEMDQGSADVFTKAWGAHDLTRVQKLLDEQAKQSRQQSVNEVAAEMDLRSKRYAQAKAGYDKLGQEIDALQGKAGAEEQINQKLSEQAKLEEAMHELRQRNTEDTAYLEEEASKTDEVIHLKQQYLNLLKQQEMVMQSLDQLSSQGPLDTVGGRLDTQLGALDQQLGTLEAAWKMLHQRGDAESIEAAKQVQQEILEHEARRAALDSPQMRMTAQIYDYRQVAAHRAGVEAQSGAVGYTDSDKLLNQQRDLQAKLREIRAKEAAGTMSDSDAVRAKVFEIQLWETQEKIQTRILELARQEKQIRLDATREFNKGLLLAGPGELLQRLHVSQLMRRPGGMSPGEFFAMSPENRRMYFEAMGGEAGMVNRMEQRRMAGHAWSLTDAQIAGNTTRYNVEHWNSRLRGFTDEALGRLSPMPLPQLDTNARNAAANLGLLGSVAASTTAKLKSLSDTLEAMVKRIPGWNVPHHLDTRPPTVDLVPPHALGAQLPEIPGLRHYVIPNP